VREDKREERVNGGFRSANCNLTKYVVPMFNIIDTCLVFSSVRQHILMESWDPGKWWWNDMTIDWANFIWFRLKQFSHSRFGSRTWKHLSILLSTIIKQTQQTNKITSINLSTSIRIGTLWSWFPRCRLNDPGHTQGYRHYHPHSEGIKYCIRSLVISCGGCCMRRWIVFCCHLHYGTHAGIVAIWTTSDIWSCWFSIGNVVAVSEWCTVRRRRARKTQSTSFFDVR